jgi:tRNA-dihydrouridine synthase B
MIAECAKYLEQYADMIDINMGCPVNKVVKGTDGCALMRNPDLAEEIVKEVKNTIKIPLSVKFRLGYTFDEMNFVEFGGWMQEAGADFITIHGRTRRQMYSGKADWSKIADLKKSVDIPVFANGDVTSIESAEKCMELSGADGVAVGRASIGDASLLYRIEHFFATGERLPEPKLEDKLNDLKTHLNEEINLRGEKVGIKFMRKFYPFYINGVKNAAKYRGRLVLIEDYNEIMSALDYIYRECNENIQVPV